MGTGKESKGSAAPVEGKEKLQEIYELSILYDFYGELLSDHKKQIFEDYILNDLSLAEIADNTGISRQGVHDIIKRCTKALRGYEEALHLAEKFGRIKQIVSQIRELAETVKFKDNSYKRESGNDENDLVLLKVQEIVECAEHILQEL